MDLEAQKKVAELEPLRTQSFQLNYAKAEDIMKQIAANQALANQQSGGSGGSNRMLSPRGAVNFDMRTNQVFVTDIPSKLEEIAAVIAKIDIPVRQVLIEARIVEADDSFGRALGVKLGYADLRGAPTSAGANVGGNYNAIGAQTGQTPGRIDFTNSQFVNLPANVSNLGGASAGHLRAVALRLGSQPLPEPGTLGAGGRRQGQDRLQPARHHRRPGGGARSSRARNCPTRPPPAAAPRRCSSARPTWRCEVTPQITPEGNVILDVDVNKDSVGRATMAGFAIDTKHVKTQVLVENGGTVVIGGIFTQTDRDHREQGAAAGRHPGAGLAVQEHRRRTTSKTELLVFITPKIVTDRSAVR